MARLVECVPNFSEGRRIDVVDALAAAVTATPHVHLLDRTSDRDHNRSVLTFAGPSEAVTSGMEAAVAVALGSIDMNLHEGAHPRMGAIDVIPFVPLADTTMAEAVELARLFGAHIAERFGLPVYLYARAATRPERVVLADVRRPQFEGLRSLIADDPERVPDLGPRHLHKTGGAVAVGARPFLIAYNINLASDDVALAKRIAAAIREKGGGLPRVQALGLHLADLGCAQVSMNLLDHAVTPLWQVWEEVGRLAREAGVELLESELIGLAPMAALTDVADRLGISADRSLELRMADAAAWLRVRDFEPTMALELRLARAEASS
ncbi:MAG: glutamate formimidoyltransferase [Chloroflexi bacterium]|nr:glutamate formimidoyltransferase [Chloroflexota bacterium]